MDKTIDPTGIVFRALAVFFAILVFLVPASTFADDSKTLKVGLLPIIDALPFHVAKAGGYFDDHHVRVEAIPVSSALERDQLMQAGQIDGMINEMTSVAMFNREKVRLKIVGDARASRPGFPLFRILASPESGVSSPGDLAGVAIGISKNTIIEYVTDRLLTRSGLAGEQIVKQSVPVIPERYQLLLQGRIRAATIPDPLALSAVRAGAVQVIDDTAFPSYSVSVLSFSNEAIQEKAAAVAGFAKAWDRAAGDINAAPESFRSLMLANIRVPDNIRDTFKIPPFPRNHVPDRSQWADMMEWMVEKWLLEAPVAYEICVTDQFLP